jgi:steroid 5-alpha reductase family enzyme
MTVLCLEALAGIAFALSILTAITWGVRRRTGNSGWIDTIQTFAVGLVGAGGAPWPLAGAAPRATLLAPAFIYRILVHVTGIPPLEAQVLRPRGERDREYQARTGASFLLPPQNGVVT